MKQDIKFQGLSSSPSDYDAQDGELGTCLNLINEDGALKPIAQPEIVDSDITIPDGATIELVHKVTHNNEIHSHYIIHRADDTWCWTERGGDGTFTDIDLGEFKVNAVTAVGNILNFVGDTNIKYAYWKDNVYSVTDFSDVKFNATISIQQAAFTEYDEIVPLDNYMMSCSEYIENKETRHASIGSTLNSTDVDKLFSIQDAYVNKYMDDYSFKYIQFGVLALQMYDGTYKQIGNPFIITNGTSSLNDIYLWRTPSSTNIEISTNKKTFYPESEKEYALLKLSTSQSLYNAVLNINIQNIELYKELISGVTVFVSNSVFPYNSNCNIVKEQEELVTSNVVIGSDTVTLHTEDYGDISFYFHVEAKVPSFFLGHWNYPQYTEEELYDEIGKLVFYKSTSFSYDEIVQKKEKKLKRIYQTEEAITLANNQQAIFGAKVAITYNNRLHLANVSTVRTITSNGLVFDSAAEVNRKLIFKIKYKVNSEYYTTYSVEEATTLDIFSFYSDNVVSFEIYSTHMFSDFPTYYHKKLDMKSISDFGLSLYLNYANGKLNTIELTDGDEITEDEWNSILKEAETYQSTPIISHSLIKVSEAENPIVFPAKNSVQVGSSIINALAANTRPISEGQFGEAPLYAFTDEGVWALMTGSEGTYQAKQPANREICTNPKSILQIDDAVLFATERGIMLQSGRESECITDALDDYPFDFTQLFNEEFAKEVLALGNTDVNLVKYARFRDYLQQADMIYDYYDSRIIVFNTSYPYAYVYSLKSKKWGTMTNTIKNRVNIYPESYALNGDGKIVDMYVKEPTAAVPYFLCSRPIGLGTPEVYKTMFASIVRGYFDGAVAGKCAMILYGSNDLLNWKPIKTSVNKYLRGMVGSPYKYFRIALIGSLNPNESISGMSTDFQERWQNKLR